MYHEFLMPYVKLVSIVNKHLCISGNKHEIVYYATSFINDTLDTSFMLDTSEPCGASV
jgi:hypothetical protein